MKLKQRRSYGSYDSVHFQENKFILPRQNTILSLSVAYIWPEFNFIASYFHSFEVSFNTTEYREFILCLSREAFSTDTR